MTTVTITRSHRDNKAYKAVFLEPDGRRKTVHFGSNYENYTQHKDKARRERYLARHAPRENWDDPRTAGALSRWLLWHCTSLKAAITAYRKRFGFKSVVDRSNLSEEQ
jgi:hypothetical protein